MSESAQPRSVTIAPPRRGSRAGKKSGLGPAIVAVVGCLLTIAAIGLVLRKADIGMPSGNAAQPTVSFVAQDEIGAAATTLTPSAAAALVDDAQRCRIPLVSITIAKGTAPIGSTIRVRSGSYVSPFFPVTQATHRVAGAHPSPFGSGAGTLVFQGNAPRATLGLTPTRVLVELPRPQTHT